MKYGDKIIEKNSSILFDRNGIFEKFSKKACCWSYEKEYRVYKVPSTFYSDDATGVHPFNSNLVDAIYLGLRVDEETKNRIVEIIKLASHKIDLFQSVKNKTHLVLDYEKI